MKKLALLSLLMICFFCTREDNWSHRRAGIKGLPSDISMVATGNLTGSKEDELILGRDSFLYIYQAISDSAVLLDSVRATGDQILVQVGSGDEKNLEKILL